MTQPLEVASPVADEQRIRLVDALRGIAVLGILMMNIPIFAMPEYFSESFRSDPGNVNFWVNAVVTVFFEGKMRALFGILFLFTFIRSTIRARALRAPVKAMLETTLKTRIDG